MGSTSLVSAPLHLLARTARFGWPRSMRRCTTSLTVGVSMLMASAVVAQPDLVPGDGSRHVVATCGGTVLDPGGAGPVLSGQSGALTIYPDQDGRLIQIEVDQLGLGVGDQLQIHGGWTTGEIVWDAVVFGVVGHSVVASSAGSGALTVVFEAAAGGSAGFELTVSCVPEGAVRIGDHRYHHAWGTLFTDSGGLDAGYGPNESHETRFYSPDVLEMRFVLFDVEACCDALDVRTFDGTYLQTLPSAMPIFQDGGFRFDFSSNGSQENGGWEAYPRTRRSIPSSPTQPHPVAERLTLGQPGTPVQPYADNLHVETWIQSPSADLDLFLFVRPFLGSGDSLKIYGGDTSAAPLLRTVQLGDAPEFIGLPGSPDLYLEFTSDASDAGSWDAMVTSMATMHQDRSVRMCDREVIDSGALEGGYGPDEDVTLTIHPDDPSAWVELSFNFFETEAGWDTLTVHDGDSTAAPVLGVFSGFSLPPTVASTQGSGGALTLHFESDSSNQFDGFLADSTCRRFLFADGFESGDLSGWQ